MLENGQVIRPDVQKTPLTPEQESIENIKRSIKILEGIFYACEAASFPLKFYNAVTAGMNMLGQMHTQLVGQLPPDEVQKIKDEEAARVAAAQSMNTSKPGTPTEVA